MRKRNLSMFIVACMLVSSILGIPISTSAAETWLWPIENYYNVNSGYGHRTYNNSWHSGIDIDSIGPGNILGKPVRAAKSGYATVYHNNATAGNYISINHGDGYVSRYLHLDSIAISSGNVTRGQIIGYAGNTGNSSGPHLHFDIKYNGDEINPMPINYNGRHTYIGSSAAFSENIKYDYDDSSTSKPTNCTITASDTFVQTGQSVTFTFTQSGATYWYCDVENESGVRQHCELVTGEYSYTYTFNEEGKYKVFLKAANDAGWTEPYVWITVSNQKPTNVSIKASDTFIKPGESVKFDFTLENAAYWYFEVHNEAGYEIYEELATGSYSKTYTFANEGKYKVYLKTANENGWTEPYVWITVSSSSFTASTVKKRDDSYIVETELFNIASPCDIIVVGYKNNRFVTMKTTSYSQTTSSCTLTGDMDEIKVMVWDGLSTLKPLCDAEVIPSSKWITE